MKTKEEVKQERDILINKALDLLTWLKPDEEEEIYDKLITTIENDI